MSSSSCPVAVAPAIALAGALAVAAVTAGCPPAATSGVRSGVTLGADGRPLGKLELVRRPPYPVAFAPETGGGDHRLAGDVWRLARDDLKLSGLFTTYDNADDAPAGGTVLLVRVEKPPPPPPPRASATGAAAQPRRRRPTGPRALLRTRIFAAAGGEQKLVRAAALAGGRDARAMAHRLANAIYRAYVGARGPFLSRIAFVARTAGATPGRQVFVVDYTGYGVYRVSKGGRHNILPAWSPAGDLVYTSYKSGNPDLYLLAAGGGAARPISRQRGLNVGGVFSPDGRTIALTLTRTGNSDVHLIDRSGRVLRQLTRHPAIDTSPSWSPDGRRIAFVSARAGRPQIFIVPADGSAEPRQLTREGYENQRPRWCPLPGSRLIAYTSRGDRGFDIYVIDAASGRRRRLTQGPGDNKSPSWSPRCQHLVYSGGDSGLWTISARGGAPRRIYAAPAWTPHWSR